MSDDDTTTNDPTAGLTMNQDPSRPETSANRHCLGARAPGRRTRTDGGALPTCKPSSLRRSSPRRQRLGGRALVAEVGLVDETGSSPRRRGDPYPRKGGPRSPSGSSPTRPPSASVPGRAPNLRTAAAPRDPSTTGGPRRARRIHQPAGQDRRDDHSPIPGVEGSRAKELGDISRRVVRLRTHRNIRGRAVNSCQDVSRGVLRAPTSTIRNKRCQAKFITRLGDIRLNAQLHREIRLLLADRTSFGDTARSFTSVTRRGRGRPCLISPWSALMAMIPWPP